MKTSHKLQSTRVAFILFAMILTSCGSQQEAQLPDALDPSISDVVSAERSRSDTTKNMSNTPKTLSGTIFFNFVGDAWYEIVDDSGRKISALRDTIPESDRIPNAGMTSERFAADSPEDIIEVHGGTINDPSSGVYRILITGKKGTNLELMASCMSPELKERKESTMETTIDESGAHAVNFYWTLENLCEFSI